MSDVAKKKVPKPTVLKNYFGDKKPVDTAELRALMAGEGGRADYDELAALAAVELGVEI